jgi:hypothetical protein
MSDAYALTGDVEFLKKPLEYLGVSTFTSPVSQLQAALEADTSYNPTNHFNGQYDTWPNRAALLGRMQP